MVPPRVATAVTVGESKRSGISASLTTAFARPKSSTFTVPSGRSLIFAGLRSRWMIPCSWAASRASAICFAIGSASSSGMGPRVNRCARSSPSTSSITRAVTSLRLLQPVDGGDVRVIQRGEDFCFALKPRHSFRVSNEGLRQDLDGHVAIEPCVARPIHFPHPASAEGGENLVRPETRAGGQRHESGADSSGGAQARQRRKRRRTRRTSSRRSGSTFQLNLMQEQGGFVTHPQYTNKPSATNPTPRTSSRQSISHTFGLATIFAMTLRCRRHLTRLWNERPQSNVREPVTSQPHGR